MISNMFTTDASRPIDLICMGRVAVDLYAEQIGVPLDAVESFKKYLGGCAGNIAVGTARLNLNVCLFSAVGQDAMGKFLIHELQRENVITSFIDETPRHLTGLVLLGISPPHHFPLIFYRENCADMQFRIEEKHRNTLSRAKALLITGTGLSTPTMSEQIHRAVSIAHEAKTKVILDCDYRPVLWNLMNKGDGETRYRASREISRHYQAMLPRCDLIVGTEEECLIAAGEENLDHALTKIRSLSQAPVVVKRGERGCSIHFQSTHDDLNVYGLTAIINHT